MAEATNPITTASNPRVGPLERVRHLKRGTEYEVLGEAEAQVATGTMRTTMLGKPIGGIYRRIADGSSLTVYRDPTTGKLWCRPTDEFRDGRFETLASAPSPEAGAGGDLGRMHREFLQLSDDALTFANETDSDSSRDHYLAAWATWKEAAHMLGKLVASTGSGEETKGEPITQDEIVKLIARTWLSAKGTDDVTADTLSDPDELALISPEDHAACVEVADTLLHRFAQAAGEVRS